MGCSVENSKNIFVCSGPDDQLIVQKAVQNLSVLKEMLQGPQSNNAFMDQAPDNQGIQVITASYFGNVLQMYSRSLQD